MILLSILICSTHTRRNTFLPKISDRIYSMYEALPEQDQDKVEIIILTDNKKMMLGHKRNCMIDICQGKYIAFVDDDDRIEGNYLSELLGATATDADVITFNVSVSINGGKPKIAHYSKDFPKDYNTASSYFRLPNHICCVKRDVSLKVSFPNLKYAEDAAYAKLLKQHLKTEHQINKILYHYDYHDSVTETQDVIPNSRLRKRPTNPIVDVIFLSNAKTDAYRRMTEKAIKTCLLGANGLSVNVIVIEQQPKVRYEDAETVYHNADFNYNAFANLGTRQGSAPWIMIANNDIIFRDGWLHALLSAEHDLVSPRCPKDPRQKGITTNEIGEQNGRYFSGWCFMIKRQLWEQIDGFDESITFWFSDDATIEQCVKKGVKPMLVPTSIVEHLGSTTLRSLDSDKKDDYTWGQCEIFNKKYGRNKFHDNPHYHAWRRKNTVSA